MNWKGEWATAALPPDYDARNLLTRAEELSAAGHTSGKSGNARKTSLTGEQKVFDREIDVIALQERKEESTAFRISDPISGDSAHELCLDLYFGRSKADPEIAASYVGHIEVSFNLFDGCQSYSPYSKPVKIVIGTGNGRDGTTYEETLRRQGIKATLRVTALDYYAQNNVIVGRGSDGKFLEARNVISKFRIRVQALLSSE